MTNISTTNDRRSHPDRILRITGLALAGVAGLGLVFSAGAHESWRKLVDAQPAVEAPIWSLSAMQDGGPAGTDNPDTVFESENVTLLSWIPLSAFPGGHSAGNDCWGYTSPSGREYAIMGLQRGCGFVEVTDPTNPVVIDFIAPFGDGFQTARDLKRTVFPDRALRSVRRDGNGHVLRIVQHPGRDQNGHPVKARAYAA